MKRYAALVILIAMVGSSLVAQTQSGGKNGVRVSGGRAGDSSAAQGRSNVKVNDPNDHKIGTTPGETKTTPAGTLGTTGDISTSGVGAGAGIKPSGGAILEPSGAAVEQAGTITLHGLVTSDEERKNIEERVRQSQGVKRVINKLEVSAGHPTNDTPPEK